MEVDCGCRMAIHRKTVAMQKGLCALVTVICFLIQIPPRSPDLNPIENFFHLVRCKLKRDALALNITKETLEEFRARIIRTIYSIPVDLINRTIASMPARLQQVIDSKGYRIKN